MRKLRWDRRIHSNAAYASIFHATQEFLDALDIHGLGEDILHYFFDQRVIRNLNVAFYIFLAGRDIGED